MITKDKLKDYAQKLLFNMKEEEYDILLKEFEITLKQMDLIGKIEGIDKVEPMTFPYILDDHTFREDICEKGLTKEEAFLNAKETYEGSIIVPKIVGGE